jgi:hypothetical protein
MNTNRMYLLGRDVACNVSKIALVVGILAGALLSLTACASNLPGPGGNTPMPYTINTGNGEPAARNAGGAG